MKRVCEVFVIFLDMNSCKRVNFKVLLCMKNTYGKENRRCPILLFNWLSKQSVGWTPTKTL